MKIALDYDGTYSADPELFNIFIRIAQQRGHEVYCVTMRYDSLSEKVCDIVPCKVFYTGRMAKIPYMKNIGYEFDIWIDDMPHLLFDAPLVLFGDGENSV